MSIVIYRPYQLNLEEKELYKKWVEAKEARKFEVADKLRSQLIAKGII